MHFKKKGGVWVAVLLATFGLNGYSQERPASSNAPKVTASPKTKDPKKAAVKKNKDAAQKERTQLETKKREWASGSQ